MKTSWRRSVLGTDSSMVKPAGTCGTGLADQLAMVVVGLSAEVEGSDLGTEIEGPRDWGSPGYKRGLAAS